MKVRKMIYNILDTKGEKLQADALGFKDVSGPNLHFYRRAV